MQTTMTDQQTSPRKRLWPKRPSNIIKKRKAFVTYNRRDHKLTVHQESWARSLAVSLSGWHARQTFIKVHLEAHLQAEALSKAVAAEREAHDAARRAAVQIQQVKLEEKLQAEAAEEHARKSAAWARKTSLMRQAGIEKSIIEAWDPEKEVYIRSIKLDERISALITERNEGDSEDDENYLNSDVGGLKTEIPGIPSPPRSQPAPIVQSSPAPAVDWRVKARNGIIKKKLSITKRWSSVTWNQKSNVQERLLLLEDDGFDTEGLENRRATSEKITAVILERAAAMQRPDTTADTPTQKPQELEPHREESHDSSPAWLDPVLRQLPSSAAVSATSPTTHPPLLNAQLATQTLGIPSRQLTMALKQQPATRPVREDDTQPFSFNESYHPQASFRLKRKRDCDTNSEDVEGVAASTLPALKKHKVEYLTEDGFRLQALGEIKLKVLRRVFRFARSIVRKSSPPSKVLFSAEVAPVEHVERKTPFSTLDYLYARKRGFGANSQPLSITSCGVDILMRELRFLTNTSDQDGDISIYDPDFDEELDHSPLSAEDRIKQNLRNIQRQKSRIVISRDQQSRLVFQGDTQTLAELFKVLRGETLLHRAEWEWDGLRLSPANRFLWSLSPETQSLLMEVEYRLRQHTRTGGVEVCIHRVGDGCQARL